MSVLQSSVLFKHFDDNDGQKREIWEYSGSSSKNDPNVSTKHVPKGHEEDVHGLMGEEEGTPPHIPSYNRVPLRMEENNESTQKESAYSDRGCHDLRIISTNIADNKQPVLISGIVL